MEYTNKESIENYLLKTIDDSFDVQLTEWIVAMSKHIDKACNRVIFRSTEETFLYDGDGTESLIIKDCVDISDVSIDGTSIEYFKYPANSEVATLIKRPTDIFPRGMQNVSVTGIQAHSNTLPADIKHACTVLVAGIINAQIFNEKDGITEKIGNYSVTYASKEQKADFQLAKSILSSYKRIAL